MNTLRFIKILITNKIIANNNQKSSCTLLHKSLILIKI